MYRKPCTCGQKTAEIFFGKMVLDQSAIANLYCPECSHTVDVSKSTMVEDNGWVIELDPDVMRAFAPRMSLDPETVTAEKVFDGDYVTWVGFSPEDNQRRTTERECIMKETCGDTRAQFEALKKWAVERERKFYEEGWRKASTRVRAA
jgi:hypothetical protein